LFFATSNLFWITHVYPLRWLYSR